MILKPFKLACLSAACLALALSLTSCCCPPQGGTTVNLFDGKSLSGWKYISQDMSVPMDQVWSVNDGVIVCQGKPIGAIYGGPAVSDFRLVVEYRWAPGTTPGNSGIFSRIGSPLKPLPPCYEVQLKHGSAGDTMGLQGKPLSPDQPRFFSVKAHPDAGDVAGVRKLSDQEKPPGEWNRVEILAQGSKYQVWLNGQLVNEAEGAEAAPGPIGLQSEGGVIHFRNVKLTRL